MKLLKVTFLVVFVLVGLSGVQAQKITWDHQITDTVFGLDIHPDVESHNKITIQDSGLYRWVRKVTTACPIETAICDKNQCYLEHVDSAVFYVDENETFTMIAHFYPNNNCCKFAQIDLEVYKVSDPAITSTASYMISLWCTQSSVADILGSNVTVAPNPAVDILTIEGLTQPANLVVYNNLGQQVMNVDQSTSVFVGELKPGVYFVEVSSEDAVIRKKFIKQ